MATALYTPHGWSPSGSGYACSGETKVAEVAPYPQIFKTEWSITYDSNSLPLQSPQEDAPVALSGNYIAFGAKQAEPAPDPKKLRKKARKLVKRAQAIEADQKRKAKIARKAAKAKAREAARKQAARDRLDEIVKSGHDEAAIAAAKQILDPYGD